MCENPHVDMDRPAVAELMADVSAALTQRVSVLREDVWSGVCRTRTSFHEGPRMAGLEIFDRIGGGDSFVSGLTYGLLAGFDVGTALAFGTAHGALVMTTPGDTSMATLAEVRRLAAGRPARVIR